MSTIVLLQRSYLTKNLSSFLQDFFHKKSLIAVCYTLIQKRFKNQTVDSPKLLLQLLIRVCQTKNCHYPS